MTLPARLPPAAICALLWLMPPIALACSVTTTPVVFGAIDPIARMPTDSTGTLVVTCPVESSYTVAIDGGSNGSVDLRNMSGATGSLLRYQLYTDPSLALVWGDGTAGTMTVSGSAGPGMDATHTIYGRVPAQPLARVGSYADTLTVTVTF